jgi:DNA uptake protein ComE-like DNA-binding protein
MIGRKWLWVILPATLLACAEATNDDDAAPDSLAADTATSAAGPAETPTAAPNGMIDPNTASAEQLAAIPGLNATLVSAVMNGRPYNDMTALNKKLTGLTDEQRDTVYSKIWKPLDLNNATKEEIELIPGVGPRMRHEFEEYRPYTSMEQFRREIGKYVDDAEVARLERYVTIRSASQ